MKPATEEQQSRTEEQVLSQAIKKRTASKEMSRQSAETALRLGQKRTASKEISRQSAETSLRLEQKRASESPAEQQEQKAQKIDQDMINVMLIKQELRPADRWPR